MSTVKNPSIPCEIPIPGGMSLGTMVTVQGTIPQNSDRFAINLLCQSGDVALHVSPKFRENYVARNNVQHMTWGKEERSGGLPIFPGQSFEIIILCEEKDFKVCMQDPLSCMKSCKIAINGDHFAEFVHRVPIGKISSVEVEGNVIVDNIHFGGESSSVSDISNPSASSYGFQPRAPSPYVNSEGGSGGGLYPSVPTEPSAPFPVGPNSGGGMYPSAPGPFPTGPSSGGGVYPPSVPPQKSHSPSPGPYPPSSGGGFYPPPSQPSYPPAGPYPSGNMGAGGYYPSPQPPSPHGGPYPSSGPQYPGQGPSLYPTQPGYGPDPHQGMYPQAPNQNPQVGSKNSSKSSFLGQAGMAIAGVLGPVLLAKGIRKARGANANEHDQGRPDILGQAAGTLAGLLGGGGGYSGYNHHKHGVMGNLGAAVAGPVFANHLNPVKAAKKQMKAQKKALKYGLPLAGAGLGAYALHKGLKKGFRRSSSSSSGSSSDS